MFTILLVGLGWIKSWETFWQVFNKPKSLQSPKPVYLLRWAPTLHEMGSDHPNIFPSVKRPPIAG
jgi:hypothetical protein